MTRDDIIRMAREVGMAAGIGRTSNGKYAPNVNALGKSIPVEWLERFAALAAAAEREACARLIEAKKEWRGGKWVSTLCPMTTEAIASAIRLRKD